ncbi:MAG: phage portal protein family [Verrucomicrobiaceae bacterium]|nr:phage portal protein family [Verrucomicrobiaceae bacterium]
MFGFGKRKQLESELAELRTQIADINNKSIEFGGLDWSEFYGAVASSSGIAVTAETAKRSTAVYACTSLIAGAVALLPFPVYQRIADAREVVDNHPVYWLLNEQPFATLTSAAFWEWMVASMLLRGDGIARIVRNAQFQPIGFEPLQRNWVAITRVGAQLQYYVSDGINPSYGLDQSDVLHFPGFGFNGWHGESVIQHAAKQAIGTALAADEYSGEFFANGSNPSSVIEYPAGVAPTTEQQDRLRDSYTEKYTGSGNRHKPLLLLNGGQLKAVTMTAADSQLLETRKFQIVDIARAFKVPPHMIGETSASTSWGSGIEQMSLGFVRYTLGPHLRRIEQELNRKLWPRSTKYFVEFNRDGLLAGDSKAEAEYFGKALGGPGSQGWMTINEARKIKNLPPVLGGDKLRFAAQQPTKPGSPNEPDSTVSEQSENAA